jgi:alkanesulfonate monooxygenase
MSASFFWTLPVEGSDREPAQRRAFVGALRDERRDRFTYYDYLLQVARAAESAGFTGALVPWNERGDDSWIVAASLAREVRRLTFLPELQPGFTTPVYLAKLSASFQRLSGNRLAWKLDLERDPAVRRAHGDTAGGSDWFVRADEFLSAAKGAWSREPFDFDGRFFAVEKGGLKAPLAGRPLPTIYSAGRSDDALAFAAKHADVHLLEGGADALRAQIDRLDLAVTRATETGVRVSERPVGRGIRLTVVARHTPEEARHAAARVQADALVGDYTTVAARIDALGELGVDHFIFDGTPHVEEAFRIGEHVFPQLTAAARPAVRAA